MSFAFGRCSSLRGTSINPAGTVDFSSSSSSTSVRSRLRKQESGVVVEEEVVGIQLLAHVSERGKFGIPFADLFGIKVMQFAPMHSGFHVIERSGDVA